MKCEIVFNELSVRKPAETVKRARQRMNGLVELMRLASRRTGSRQLRISSDFFAIEVGPRYPVRKWLNDDRVDIETRRLLRSYASSQSYITRQDPPEILEQWNCTEAWVGESRAHGLFAAFLLDSLALSVPSESTWNKSTVHVRILRLDEGEVNSAFTDVEVPVKNLAKPEHLDRHVEWLDNRDGAVAVFRRKVDPVDCHHVPASFYSKHVVGSTNDERRSAARRSGNGQFLATLDGQSVDDESIRRWEVESLKEGWEGAEDVKIVLRGEGEASFHLYCRRGHSTGYAGHSGQEIDTLRVEWSSRQVHSHPRVRDT